VAVSALLALVALLACVLPARRVLRVDLVGVLKGD
jgi:ABC-type lipoprotein release transport system permease subunit